MDAGIVLPEQVPVESIPEWQDGVPEPLTAFGTCALRSASYSAAPDCQIQIDCDYDYNDGMLLATCLRQMAEDTSSCACVWGGEYGDSVVFFSDTPYDGADLEPCISAMNACALDHTE